MSYKRILCSHIDLDGLGCILVADYFKEEFDRIVCADYKNYENETFPMEDVLKYDEIIFTDFSPSPDLLDKIIEKDIKLTIIDHHRSLYETWEANKEKLENLKSNKIEIVFNDSKSGTLLYCEYIKAKTGKRISKVFKQIVEAIDTYDLFRTDRDNWEIGLSLNRLLWANFLWAFKNELSSKKFNKFLSLLKSHIQSNKDFSWTFYEKNAISSIKEKEKDIYKKALSSMLVRTDCKGKKFGIIRVKSKLSIVAFTILHTRKDLDYLLGINEFNKEELKLSGRSREFNLLQLNNTKGHAKACGSEDMTNEIIEKLWNGREMYELGYDEDYVEDIKELEVLHEHY